MIESLGSMFIGRPLLLVFVHLASVARAKPRLASSRRSLMILNGFATGWLRGVSRMWRWKRPGVYWKPVVRHEALFNCSANAPTRPGSPLRRQTGGSFFRSNPRKSSSNHDRTPDQRLFPEEVTSCHRDDLDGCLGVADGPCPRDRVGPKEDSQPDAKLPGNHSGCLQQRSIDSRRCCHRTQSDQYVGADRC